MTATSRIVVLIPIRQAYSDVYAANFVFQKSLENIPESLISTEDLVNFIRPNPKKRKKKKSTTDS